jgi:hypothetical protein
MIIEVCIVKDGKRLVLGVRGECSQEELVILIEGALAA